ncbi:hypothetical protein DdX_18178 [Ditylenchus destructor]|uniref:Uncharacterized protein n=1 Tax=Ditylenchus destructor TaxID=166010 RepID=A0AAD4QYC0_9BILA|nr:hypothetical protein DdX_18175 [Ditylenchus destructor]KAI1697986.1 hypothetical protein DdX_18178 [Ditylenchus destructor]
MSVSDPVLHKENEPKFLGIESKHNAQSTTTCDREIISDIFLMDGYTQFQTPKKSWKWYTVLWTSAMDQMNDRLADLIRESSALISIETHFNAETCTLGFL